MKSFFTPGLILSAFLLFSCSKPSPVDPGTSGTGTTTPTTGGGTTPPSSSSAPLSVDPLFRAPTGFQSSNAAIQSDGKIIINAVTSVNNQTVVKLYRLNTDGSLDNSFNIDVDKTWIIKYVSGIFAMADGKVLLGGEFTISGQRLTLLRLTSNGALDKTYSSPGIYDNILMQKTANNKVLISFIIKGYSLSLDHAFPHMIRLNSDGTLDQTFSVPMLSGSSNTESITQMVPLVNGKILIAGDFMVGSGNGLSRQNVARLNDDGSIDYTFNFKELANAGGKIMKMVVQTNGKPVIAGSFSKLTDPNIRDATYNIPGIARLNANGDIDQTFKTPTSTAYGGILNDMILLSDNRIITNTIGIYPSNINKSQLALYGSDGALETFDTPVQNSTIVNIVKESTDNFLLIGTISLNGANYPVVRFKK